MSHYVSLYDSVTVSMLAELTSDIKKTVGEKSEAAPLALHDVTEGSVHLGLLSVHLAAQWNNPGPRSSPALLCLA